MQAKGGVSWRKSRPAQNAPGHTTWLFLGEDGTPSFQFETPPSRQSGRPVIVPHVEVVEILTQAAAQRSFDELRRENLNLRVTDETGKQSQLDLTTIPAAQGVPTRSRHAKPGASASSSWWMKDVVQRIRTDAKPVGLQLSTASGETITLSAEDLAASFDSYLMDSSSGDFVRVKMFPILPSTVIRAEYVRKDAAGSAMTDTAIYTATASVTGVVPTMSTADTMIGAAMDGELSVATLMQGITQMLSQLAASTWAGLSNPAAAAMARALPATVACRKVLRFMVFK